MVKTLFVSRHAGALEWLREHHPGLAEGCEHLTHAYPTDLVGNVVIGTLPVHLAALCEEYWHLSMNIPPELRGQELSAAQMAGCGCRIERYTIRRGGSKEE